MELLTLVGVVLIGIGIIALVFNGIPYQSEKGDLSDQYRLRFLLEPLVVASIERYASKSLSHTARVQATPSIASDSWNSALNSRRQIPGPSWMPMSCLRNSARSAVTTASWFSSPERHTWNLKHRTLLVCSKP